MEMEQRKMGCVNTVIVRTARMCVSLCGFNPQHGLCLALFFYNFFVLLPSAGNIAYE